MKNEPKDPKKMRSGNFDDAKILFIVAIVVVGAIFGLIKMGKDQAAKNQREHPRQTIVQDTATTDSGEALPKTGHDQEDSVAIRQYRQAKKELGRYENRKHDSLQPGRPKAPTVQKQNGQTIIENNDD